MMAFVVINIIIKIFPEHSRVFLPDSAIYQEKMQLPEDTDSEET